MLRWSLYGAFFAALFTLGACTTPMAGDASNSSRRDCFASSSILGFNIIDEHNVKIRVGAGRDYILSTTWNARDLDWSEAIALRSTTGWICTGNGLGVEVRGGRPPQTYPITGIARALLSQRRKGHKETKTMNLRLAFTAALVALAASAAPLTTATAAEQPNGPRDDCFPTRAITGYGISDEHTAYLTVGTRHYFVHITGSARDLDWDHNVSVRSFSSFICTGNGLGVQLMGGYPPIPHQVVGIERAPPGEPPHWSPGYHGEEHPAHGEHSN